MNLSNPRTEIRCSGMHKTSCFSQSKPRTETSTLEGLSFPVPSKFQDDVCGITLLEINVREYWMGNQEWTIERNWQKNVRENRRGNQKRTIQRNWQKTTLENTEGPIKWTFQRNWQNNVRENRRGNQKWTIQRNWQKTLEKTEGAIKNGQSRETDKRTGKKR